MEQPFAAGNPYDYLDPFIPNYGSTGVLASWWAFKDFWGRGINEAWWDLENVQALGTPTPI